MLAFRDTGSVLADVVDPRRLAFSLEEPNPAIMSSMSTSPHDMASIFLVTSCGFESLTLPIECP